MIIDEITMLDTARVYLRSDLAIKALILNSDVRGVVLATGSTADRAMRGIDLGRYRECFIDCQTHNKLNLACGSF
jgi:hypothetical protein